MIDAGVEPAMLTLLVFVKGENVGYDTADDSPYSADCISEARCETGDKTMRVDAKGAVAFLQQPLV